MQNTIEQLMLCSGKYINWQPHTENYTLLVSGDYNVLPEYKTVFGVYMCSGLYESSKVNLPIYIGSAFDLHKRISYKHINCLNKGIHDHCKVLQASWARRGEDQYVWWLLESSDSDSVRSLEQKYLNY